MAYIEHRNNRIFNDVFDNSGDITTIVAQPALWEGLTGFFIHPDCIYCEIGQRKKAHDKVNKRKYLLVGTRFGTIVVFEKYPDGHNGQYTTFSGAVLNPDDLRKIIGSSDEMEKNIGQLIEFMHDCASSEEIAEQAKNVGESIGLPPA